MNPTFHYTTWQEAVK